MQFYFKPFLVHLLLSLVIAGACYWLVFQQWYPEPFWSVERVLHIFLILILVDVVVGPLLTLFVYKPGKKDLVFDMAVIIVLQIAALSYGVWSLDQARPAWLAFSVDRFELVRRVDVDERRIADAAPEFRSPALLGPQWVVASAPQNLHDRQVLLFESIAGGSDIANRPDLYAPMDSQRSLIEKAILPLSQLELLNDPQQVRRILHQYPEASGWIPMVATHDTLVVLMDKSAVSVIAVVPLEAYE